jgi:hypothetical protein
MKKFFNIAIFLFTLIILVFKFEDAGSWGFEAHKKITELAIDIILNLNDFKGVDNKKLENFKKFLSENKAIIIERCIEPDMIRNEDKDEQYNHFIDIDRYGEYPFNELPRDKAKAIEKYGFSVVQKNGLLPWRIVEFIDSLAYSISTNDKVKILKYLSWLAHYVEDAHQPLHVTENYDGQLTNQPGIHSRFETELVKYLISKNELSFNAEDLLGNLKKNALVKDKVNFAFNIVLESYRFIDEILKADIFAKSQIPPEKLYKVEKRNGRTRYIYSEEYYSIMSDKLKSLVYERMSTSAVRLALTWLTALQDARV